ncbi:hypothetical protein WICPIJ_007627 [Wickerhamomyces pijperi]|uniref:Uncharacterized protein n=1 Tax=Wickerhamomyces pijperi TaxID=599730 RepID=A0A9P8TK92_WICPI|nr:hypothetical protein WICPIJ_007627 [Wickerhamomyces pijperi]
MVPPMAWSSLITLIENSKAVMYGEHLRNLELSIDQRLMNVLLEILRNSNFWKTASVVVSSSVSSFSLALVVLAVAARSAIDVEDPLISSSTGTSEGGVKNSMRSGMSMLLFAMESDFKFRNFFFMYIKFSTVTFNPPKFNDRFLTLGIGWSISLAASAKLNTKFSPEQPQKSKDVKFLKPSFWNKYDNRFTSRSSLMFSLAKNSDRFGVLCKQFRIVVDVTIWISLFIFPVLPKPIEVNSWKSNTLTNSPCLGCLIMELRNVSKVCGVLKEQYL